MSSHREAPEISMDPVADNTDVYAFVSPDDPTTVTMIANYVPLQGPGGGPNFYAFGDDVQYDINISNNQTGTSDITYRFNFTTTYASPTVYFYNTGVVTYNAATKKYDNLNRAQTYTVTRIDSSGSRVIASNVLVPPCNVGIHSTPNYSALVAPAIETLRTGETVFCGQRAEGFFADLGAIFDLADIRPLQTLHTGPLAPGVPIDSLQGLNINTIAIKVPIAKLTKGGYAGRDVTKPEAVIGVYASASRQMTRVYDGPKNEKPGRSTNTGPFVQVSRLGNPLFNEVLVGINDKDRWNASAPAEDKDFAAGVLQPFLAQAIPRLYPLPFGHLRDYKKDRADLAAILLTGIPAGIVPKFQNYTGKVQADLLRLNTAVPPSKNPNNIGLIAGDAAGFPNGRRLDDDVVTIELRAIAGATIPLVDKTYTPDPAAGVLSDFAGQTNGAFLPHFPYLGVPNSGFASQPGPRDTGGNGA